MEKMIKQLKASRGKVIVDAYACVFSWGGIGEYELNFDDGQVCKVTWGHTGLEIYESPIFEAHHDWGSFTREPFEFLLVGQPVEAIYVDVTDHCWRSIHVVGSSDVVSFEVAFNDNDYPDGVQLIAPSSVPEHLISSNARAD